MSVTEQSSHSDQSAVYPHFPNRPHLSRSPQASTDSHLGLHSNIILPKLKHLREKKIATHGHTNHAQVYEQERLQGTLFI